jgi:hypothetical protein
MTCEVCKLGSRWVEAFSEVRDGTSLKRCCPRRALDIRNSNLAAARKMQELARDLQATAAPLRLLERRIASI